MTRDDKNQARRAQSSSTRNKQARRKQIKRDENKSNATRKMKRDEKKWNMARKQEMRREQMLGNKKTDRQQNEEPQRERWTAPRTTTTNLN